MIPCKWARFLCLVRRADYHRVRSIFSQFWNATIQVIVLTYFEVLPSTDRHAHMCWSATYRVWDAVFGLILPRFRDRAWSGLGRSGPTVLHFDLYRVARVIRVWWVHCLIDGRRYNFSDYYAILSLILFILEQSGLFCICWWQGGVITMSTLCTMRALLEQCCLDYRIKETKLSTWRSTVRWSYVQEDKHRLLVSPSCFAASLMMPANLYANYNQPIKVFVVVAMCHSANLRETQHCIIRTMINKWSLETSTALICIANGRSYILMSTHSNWNSINCYTMALAFRFSGQKASLRRFQYENLLRLVNACDKDSRMGLNIYTKLITWYLSSRLPCVLMHKIYIYWRKPSCKLHTNHITTTSDKRLDSSWVRRMASVFLRPARSPNFPLTVK